MTSEITEFQRLAHGMVDLINPDETFIAAAASKRGLTLAARSERCDDLVRIARSVLDQALDETLPVPLTGEERVIAKHALALLPDPDRDESDDEVPDRNADDGRGLWHLCWRPKGGGEVQRYRLTYRHGSAQNLARMLTSVTPEADYWFEPAAEVTTHE